MALPLISMVRKIRGAGQKAGRAGLSARNMVGSAFEIAILRTRRPRRPSHLPAPQGMMARAPASASLGHYFRQWPAVRDDREIAGGQDFEAFGGDDLPARD